MKFMLTALGAGIIATAMLSNPADARPRCDWVGHHWRCWNQHSWYHGGHAWDHGRDGRWDHNKNYGSSGRFGHETYRGGRDHRDMRYDRGEMHYGR